MKNLEELLEMNPVIAAIKGENDIKHVIKSECEVVFILTSNLFNLKSMVRELRENGKVVFVHVDLIDGLSASTHAVDYVAKNIGVDGIISTKNNLIKYAKKQGINVIQRCFLLDSLSLKNCLKYVKENKGDAIEILPGLMPKIIEKIAREVKVPIIVGGLISDKEDIMNALKAGAQGVSTTNKKIWDV